MYTHTVNLLHDRATGSDADVFHLITCIYIICTKNDVYSSSFTEILNVGNWYSC